MKTFNIYCDESCHLEHDHKDFMFLGAVSSAYNQVRRHSERILALKKKHTLFTEIKWNKVSPSKYRFYADLLDYFFDTDLEFRAVMVPKRAIDLANTSYDQHFYQMYYRLLHDNINTQWHYNVYLDIKDTLSARKVARLKEILNIEFGVFRNEQSVRSEECVLLSAYPLEGKDAKRDAIEQKYKRREEKLY